MRWGRGGDAPGSVVETFVLPQVSGWRRSRDGYPRSGVGACAPQLLAARVVKVLEGSRATWQVWHVRAETLRQLRTA